MDEKSQVKARARDAEAPIPRAVWLAASVMALGGFLGNMDGPIVAVGLRAMQADLGVGLTDIQWVATAFLLGLSSVLPLTPWLGANMPMAMALVLLFVRGAGIGLSMMPAMGAAYASVRLSDLGAATALVNIAMRVGGAVGGALSVIVLSAGLAAGGPVIGFRFAFAVLTVLCALATGAAWWLRRAEHRRPRRRRRQ
jgi:MFS family permease